ncbi:MAG: sensor histidine kinase [Lachnospiraceae bacterium]|nr:sensor histidine kinase [Lachnospiraceae bacterium]
MRRWRQTAQDSWLAQRIRISYLILLIPNLIFLLIAFGYLMHVYARYEAMLDSVVTASEFSLDFKKDFDYETYLVIAGSVSPRDSALNRMLADAQRVVEELKQVTEEGENRKRLQSAEKYLRNLGVYSDRIYENLAAQDRYEDNILIWENDVQIVTSLVQETINEYVYYENRELLRAQEDTRRLIFHFLRISAVLLILLFAAVLVFSWFVPRRITRPIEEQVRQEQTRLRKAEFELLQAQINPHFLYNTLDAIVWSAEAGNEKQVVRMVGNLSDFFRASLNKGKETVTLREELQHVRSYLEIQQIRYQDILTYEISVPDELGAYHIPKITIQPLVENALYHGIKNRRGGGTIRLIAEDCGETMEIRVTDDGTGMSAERLMQVRKGLTEKAPAESAIYGLYNVNERIRLNFGEAYGLRIESTPGEGTVVTVSLPKVTKISNEIVKK